MRGAWVVLVAVAVAGAVAVPMLAASSASAEDIVVVATTTSPGARDVLAEMLGPVAHRVEPPAARDSAALLVWGESHGAALAVLIALEDRRVYVVLPTTHRLLERVLPDDVSPTDSYAIALAASELIELAHWRDPDVDAPPDLGVPPDDVATGPDVNRDEPPADDRPPSTPDRDPPAPAPRLEIGTTVGIGGLIGVAPSLPLLAFRLGADVTLARVHLGYGAPFVGLALVFTLPHGDSAVVGANTIGLHYDRRELLATVGVRYRLGRFELRPSVRIAVAWVHVAATRTNLGMGAHPVNDDRAALAVGIGLESRVRFARRGIAALDVGVDAMTTRAPYQALGAQVLEEPRLRFTLLATAGMMLIR